MLHTLLFFPGILALRGPDPALLCTRCPHSTSCVTGLKGVPWGLAAWTSSPSCQGETSCSSDCPGARASLPSAFWWDTHGIWVGWEGAALWPLRTRWLCAHRHMRAPVLCCGCKQHWEALSSIQPQCRVWGSPVLGSGRGQVHTKLQRLSFGLNCCRLWSADGVSWLGWVAEACPRGHGLCVQGRRRGESTEAAGTGHPWLCSHPVS